MIRVFEATEKFDNERKFVLYENDTFLGGGTLKISDKIEVTQFSTKEYKDLLIRSMLNCVRDEKDKTVVIAEGIIESDILLKLGFNKENGIFTVLTQNLIFSSCKREGEKI